MPAEQLKFQKIALKSLHKLPLNIHKKIFFALERIKQNPLVGPKLTGELASYRKLRVGDYRIVYTFDSKTSIVEIVKIEHRQGIYK